MTTGHFTVGQVTPQALRRNWQAALLDRESAILRADPDPAVAEHFQSNRTAIADQFAKLLQPALKHWRTTNPEWKLPVLVEQFIFACEGAGAHAAI